MKQDEIHNIPFHSILYVSSPLIERYDIEQIRSLLVSLQLPHFHHKKGKLSSILLLNIKK